MKHYLINLWSLSLLIQIFIFVPACSKEKSELIEPYLDGFDSTIAYSIDTLILSSINKDVFPGAVVSVVQGNEIIYLKAFGNRSLVPDTLPMTENTVFDIASLSKCIGTTPAVMQLIEKGEMSLNDKVNKYIPDFKPWISNGDTVDITILHLLTHSSGLDSYISNIKACAKRFDGHPELLIDKIATESKRNFKPGTKFLYSCLNFIILQNIVEKITGERLCDYVQKNIFDVLQMKNSCYFTTNDTIPADWIIAPTEVMPDGNPLLGRVHDPLARILKNGNSGNAGIFSTAKDLSLFCMAIMNEGTYEDHQILKAETVDMMVNKPFENDSVIGRALGWDVSSSHSHIIGDKLSQHCCICHTGYAGTSIVMDLDARVAIILLTNRVHPKDTGSLKYTRKELSNIVSKMIEF